MLRVLYACLALSVRRSCATCGEGLGSEVPTLPKTLTNSEVKQIVPPPLLLPALPINPFPTKIWCLPPDSSHRWTDRPKNVPRQPPVHSSHTSLLRSIAMCTKYMHLCTSHAHTCTTHTWASAHTTQGPSFVHTTYFYTSAPRLYHLL